MKLGSVVTIASLVLMVGCGSDETKTQSVVGSAEPMITKAPGENIFNTKCATCHGSDAKGRADFPRLSGQSTNSLIKKLNGYKDGTYGNNMKAVMEPNAKALSSTQIEMVAEYISTLK